MRSAWLVLFVVGCAPAPTLSTEAGHYEVSEPDLADFGDGPGAVLAGTTWCPGVACKGDLCPVFEEGGVTLDECVEWTFTGDVVTDTDGCFTLATAGEVRWDIVPGECVLDGTLEADGLTIDVVAAEAVTAVMPQIGETLVAEAVADGTAFGEVPDDWAHLDSDPWRVVAGSEFGFFPRLVQGDSTVVWRATDGVVSATSGDATIRYDRADAFWITVESGADVQLALDVSGATFPLGEVRGVDVSEAASLDLAAFTWGDPEASTMPLGARAVVHDADGNLLFGAPITWSVKGAVTLDDSGSNSVTPGQDYVTLTDTCPASWPREITRAATLTATLGDLVADTRITWSPAVDPDAEIPDDVDPACRNACGCASRPASGSPLSAAVLTLAAFAIRARRRP